MRRLRIGIGITALAILCACGATGQVAVTPSPVASASPSPEATPSPAPQAVLVMTPSADGKHVLVQSFADPAQPVTLYTLTLPSRSIAKFISRTEIGYVVNTSPDSPSAGFSTILRMSLIDLLPVSVVKFKGSTLDFAWSPDGSNLAYLVQTDGLDGAGLNQLWMKVAASAPSALTPLITFYGRGGTGSDETMVRFSPDGKYLLMVDTVVVASTDTVAADRASFQLRSVPDGGLVWVPPSALKGGAYDTTMAAWSHSSDRLYYDDGRSGINTWDPPATVGLVAGNTLWYWPSVSPDDRFAAYEVSVSDGKPHLAVRDLMSGTVRELPGNLGRPILLSDEWMIDRHFVYRPPGMGPDWIPGPYFVLNLLTNVETVLPSSFQVIDVWTS